MNRVEKNTTSSLHEYYNNSGNNNVVEMDQESIGSSTEDGESPRSVDKRWKSSQIMRIRAEDMHLAEDDVVEGKFLLKDKNSCGGIARYVLFSRPVLPSSPLGTNNGH